PDGPGPVELVPALRPQPADLRPQHLLRPPRRLPPRDPARLHRPGRDVDRPPRRQIAPLPSRERGWGEGANFKGWQEWRDSNPRPSVLETDALPTELHS